MKHIILILALASVALSSCITDPDGTRRLDTAAVGNLTQNGLLILSATQKAPPPPPPAFTATK